MFPSVTAKGMREIDRLMVEEMGIGLLQMMEHAGRNLTEVARILLGGELKGRKIVVLVGPGNNGEGGMVAARHLMNGGGSVAVVLAQDPTRLKEVPAHQHATLSRMGVRIAVFDSGEAEELAAWMGPERSRDRCAPRVQPQRPTSRSDRLDHSSGQRDRASDPGAGSPVGAPPRHRGGRRSLYPGLCHSDVGVAHARTPGAYCQVIRRPALGW